MDGNFQWFVETRFTVKSQRVWSEIAPQKRDVWNQIDARGHSLDGEAAASLGQRTPEGRINLAAQLQGSHRTGSESTKKKPGPRESGPTFILRSVALVSLACPGTPVELRHRDLPALPEFHSKDDRCCVLRWYLACPAYSAWPGISRGGTFLLCSGQSALDAAVLPSSQVTVTGSIRRASGQAPAHCNFSHCLPASFTSLQISSRIPSSPRSSPASTGSPVFTIPLRAEQMKAILSFATVHFSIVCRWACSLECLMRSRTSLTLSSSAHIFHSSAFCDASRATSPRQWQIAEIPESSRSKNSSSCSLQASGNSLVIFRTRRPI